MVTFVYRATKSQWRCSQRAGSPWTAMVFLSCRIVFPADTCTVTVLMPSRENVHATLPSRVITGWWGREREAEEAGYRETERVRVWGFPRETLINGWLTSHTAVIYTTEVSACWHTHTHEQGHTKKFITICVCVCLCLWPAESSPCDTGSSFL